MSNERQVNLSELDPTVATSYLQSGQEGGTRLGDIQKSVPKFKKVDCYTTFNAEWAMVGDDLIFHFFVTKEREENGDLYWKQSFPQALNEVGQAHFQATSPRLVAKYTEELNSWWMRAQRYGHLLDVQAYVEAFLDRLDAALDRALSMTGTSSPQS